MAVWSEITTSSLAEIKRFDAEFFQPDYIKVEKKLMANAYDKFGNQISVLTDYHANGSYETLRQHVSLLDNPDYAYMVRTADLEEENYTKDVKYIDEHAYNYLSKSKVFGGEILINKIGSAGKVYLMPELGRPVSLGMNLFLIRTNSNLSTYFLYAYFQSYYGRKSIERFVNGTVPLTITKDSVRSVLVAVPSRTLHDEVEALVKKSFEKKKISKTLYAQAQKLLEKELELDQLVLEKPQSYETSFSEVVNHGSISSYFYQPKYKQLHNLIMNKSVILHKLVENYSSGFAFTKSHISKNKTQNKLIKINNITENGIDLMNADSLNNNGILAGKNEIAELGDILIGMSGTIGITGVVRDNASGAYINQRIFRIKPRGISSEYLALVLNSIVGKLQFERVCTGGVQSNISSKDILKVLIPRLDAKEDKIMELVKLSFQAAKESEQLLARAKKRVEDLIEGAAK
ncbi:TPA: restriction endonuclease subunit S [Legionella pneumophila]|nr:restriction endonuclease subunit S [Legionella pneumophila]HAT2066832.1 restriction endonuclease subunit S [Legionella pneumophila]HAT8592919.1 restriction endonuclease subunit S [Legionella pneumophila]HAU1576499.1 restriction endonuclease subunit S [Legionella pneumophila]HAU1681363.1 restriction endonuclease subunit S [Legionella pneumophila]HAU3699699.1 restriction endonuclease subunit S [Legionella pneumophila]